MGACNGCGNCCDPVHLPVSPSDIDLMRDIKMANKDIAGGKRTTDLRALGWMQGLVLIGKRWLGTRWTYLYACPSYDKDTKACKDYSIRPGTCRNYPWYGKEPSRGDVTMGAHCGFLPDVYRMLPIAEVR